MPKKRPEPFWREQTHCYYVQIGKKQHRLDPDEQTAWRLYHELMAKPPEERPKPILDTRLVAVILDAFLDHVKANKAPKTYTWHRDHIQNFVSAHPPTLTVAELKPHHVTRVMDDHEGWSPSTKNGFGRSVQQAFRWAKRQGLIEINPIDDVEKPGGQARELAISVAEYAQIMSVVTDPCARLLLETAWETGARPQEVRAIEARHVELEQRRIAFPVKESKGKKRQRVIYLTDEGIALLGPLCERRPTGPLLRNSDGEPWTKDSINCFFCRLQLALGRKAMVERDLGGKKPGRFIGHDILGRFYREHRHLEIKREVQERALRFFKPYRHMIRPMLLDSTNMESTLTDGIVNLCASTSDQPWGMTIFVKTGELRNAVLLPFPEGADSLAVFRGFLENDHEQIHVMFGVYEPELARWRFERERRPIHWPKDVEAYPRSIE